MKIQKRVLFLILSQLFSFCTFASGDMGLGVIFGNPTAITGKFWKDSQVAFDAGFAFSSGDYLLLYGDYLFHYPGAFRNKNEFVSKLVPYLGVGGIAVITTADRSDNDRYLGRKSGSFGAGIRIPFGLEWRPGRPTLGIFFELVPGISIAPATNAIFQAGLGLRYYF